MGYNEAKSAKDTVAGLRFTVRRCWKSMCEHDGIDPGASFVVFSDDNPFQPYYNKALQELRETLTIALPGGGYVGLKIKGNRAVVI